MFHLLSQINILKAINIIAKLSFLTSKPFHEAIIHALKQFKEGEYAQKLQINITSVSMPSHDLGAFLYDLAIHI